MKKYVVALLAAVLVCLGSFALFMAYIYPPAGLKQYSKEQFQPAWEAAAKGFCASSGLEFLGTDFIKHRAVSSNDEAYAWGVARVSTPGNRVRLAWIYIEWSVKRKLWQRNVSIVLADDDDEVYFTPTFPSQARRAATALGKAMRENLRSIREYRLQAGW